MDAQYLYTSVQVWYAQCNLSVKASWTAECGVKCVGLVCRSNQHDLPTRSHPIHQSEQLSNNTALDFPARLGAFGGQGVEFVNKDDTGSAFLRLLEDCT